MEISNIYLLQPLLIEYQDNGSSHEKIFLVDFLREKVYSTQTTHGEAVLVNNELSEKILNIVANKKAQKYVDSKILEPVEAKKKAATAIISNRG